MSDLNKQIEDNLVSIEMITIFKGKNEITYLTEDYMKFGDNATPYRLRQSPSENAPFKKFKASEADGLMRSNEYKLLELTGGKDE